MTFLLVGAGGGIRARDFWTQGVGHRCSPDYESGALARLGYPGIILINLPLSPAANYSGFSTG